MRQLIIFVTLFVMCSCPAFSAIKGGINYKIPIDYSVINETELAAQAENSYNQALKNKLNDDITAALNKYVILSNISPSNITYILRTGKLYELLNKNRLAKGCYYRAMGVMPSSPQPYFYLGEFFYNKREYSKSYKFFVRASECGYSNHSLTQNRIAELKKMLSIK